MPRHKSQEYRSDNTEKGSAASVTNSDQPIFVFFSCRLLLLLQEWNQLPWTLGLVTYHYITFLPFSWEPGILNDKTLQVTSQPIPRTGTSTPSVFKYTMFYHSHLPCFIECTSQLFWHQMPSCMSVQCFTTNYYEAKSPDILLGILTLHYNGTIFI